jgi:hypothetical protein
MSTSTVIIHERKLVSRNNLTTDIEILYCGVAMKNGGKNRMPLPATLSLVEEEKIIERGMKSFVEVGNALMRIRDNDLCTVSHDTFESYCKKRWGMSRPQAYRLIDGAKVTECLSPIGDIPASESVARPLTSIRDEEGELDLIKINEVWQEAVETAPEGVITAAHVKQVVRDIHTREEGPEEEPEPEQENEAVEPKGVFTDHYVTVAISHLKRIARDDPGRKEAGIRVIKWCIKNLCGGEYNEFRSKKDK